MKRDTEDKPYTYMSSPFYYFFYFNLNRTKSKLNEII